MSNDPRRALRRALRTPIPPDHRADLWLAGLILIVFLTQVFTGILLSLYYQPSPVTVAASVQFIMRDVSWGWLVRGVHHWSASALIVLAAIVLARMFFLGLYRSRSAVAWYVGWLVLALVVALAFTGELLTWDNQAFWRVHRALVGVESIPGIGPSLAAILRGGPEVSATTLSRTYSMHTLFAPWLVWMLLLVSTGISVWHMRRRVGGEP